jgi:uncharacterized protein YjbI with pentapeptide repeats
VAAVFLGWTLFVPAADWLAQHDLGNATGINLETARNNARGNLLALAAGLAGFGALLFTARNFALQRRSLQLAEESQRRTYELTEQGQVTDRYTKAIEQLGSDKVDIRIGGVYALERIAGDSIRDHPALSVLGRRNVDSDRRVTDLRDARLTSAYLDDADLAHAALSGAYLHHANVTRANLRSANLRGAILTNTFLRGTNLAYARLADADLTGADLRGADLTGANLTGANFSGANLTGADLTGAILSGANLTGVRWLSWSPVPAGWQINGAGRLERPVPGES